MNGLALCSGIGGLELGLRLAVGPTYRTVCHVERDAFAAAALVARMDDATLDRAPLWDDLLTFDGKPWRGVVDCVSAGFPCQPWSVAGKRKQTDDDRWIWPDVARVIREVEPRFVFLENVPGLIRGGLEHVLGDLAALGFNAEWDLFSASDVGLPHKRERWFCLADAGRGRDDARQSELVSGRRGSSCVGEIGADMAHANHAGRQEQRLTVAAGPQHGAVECSCRDVAHAKCRESGQRYRADGVGRWPGDAEQTRLGSCVVADADGGPGAHAERGPRGRTRARQAGETVLADASRGGIRCGTAPGGDGFPAQSDESLAYAARICEREPDNETNADPRSGQAWPLSGIGSHLPLIPPGPNDRVGWERVAAVDASALPALCRMAHGAAAGLEQPELRYRADRLRSLGNGVVAPVAAVAFRVLYARLMEGHCGE